MVEIATRLDLYGLSIQLNTCQLKANLVIGLKNLDYKGDMQSTAGDLQLQFFKFAKPMRE